MRRSPAWRWGGAGITGAGMPASGRPASKVGVSSGPRPGASPIAPREPTASSRPVRCAPAPRCAPGRPPARVKVTGARCPRSRSRAVTGGLMPPHVRRSRAAALFWSRAISAGLPGSGSRPGRRCRSAAPLRRRPEQRPQRPPRGGQPRSSPASGPGVRVRQGAGRRASALAVPRPVTRHREHESRLCTSSGACQGAGPVRVGVPSTTGLLRACSLACGPCVCENYRDESQ